MKYRDDDEIPPRTKTEIVLSSLAFAVLGAMVIHAQWDNITAWFGNVARWILRLL